MLSLVIFTGLTLSYISDACRVSDFQVQQNFDLDRFEGRWFFWKYFTAGRSLRVNLLKNKEHVYSGDGAGNLDVLSVGRSHSRCLYLKGKLRKPSMGMDAAKLTYQPTTKSNSTIDYWVIESDYDKYAVIYGCPRVQKQTGVCLLANSWVIVRDIETPLSQAQMDSIDQAITRVCLVPGSFKLVSHTMERCRQCDQTTWTVQPHFDLARYLGAWYEMVFKSRVPFSSVFAFSNYLHIYSQMTSGSVGVTVIGRDPAKNDQCFITRNTVRIETTSVPGKLLYFDAGQMVGDDYWIIETDYTGYAFILGCVRETTTPAGKCEGFRSWVWSRKPCLTGEQFVKLKKLFDQFCIDEDLYFITPHDDPCPQS